MGCDIHLFAEAWNAESGTWGQIFCPLETCEDCKGTGKDKNQKGEEIECYWCDGKGQRSPSFYEGRCYDDFAILADVRNGRGFAGIITGAGFDPIDGPRGVPEDASGEFLEEVAHWEADGHSHSYQTLKELLDYDWSKVTQHLGVVGPVTYYDWWKNRGKKGEPETWCGGINGPGIEHISNEKMEKLFEDGTLEAPKFPEDAGERAKYLLKAELTEGTHYVTRIVWELTYKESAVNLWGHTIPALTKYATEHKLAHDQVRICYFFDN